MHYLRTINGRLTILFVVTISIVLGAFGAINYYQASQSKQVQVDKVLNGVAERLVISLPGILWNLDQGQLQKVLASEAKSDMVYALIVTDESGKVSGGLIRDAEGKISTAAAVPSYNGPTRKVDLQYDNAGKVSKIGTAHILITTAALDREARQSLVWLIAEIVVLDVVIIVALFLGIAAVVTKPLGKIKLAFQDIAEGNADLTKRLDESRGDEFADVAHWFNVFIARLQGVFREVAQNAAQLAAAAEGTLRISDQARNAAQQQKQVTSDMAESVSQVTQQVTEVTHNAQTGSEASIAADQEAKRSRQVIAESIHSTQELASQVSAAAKVVQKLAEDTLKIDSILRTIADIADQTNLLALNAAIEAARAGEQGRGFAVVADEVRKLAERTTQSTHEIQEMVANIKEGNRKAVEAMDDGKKRSEISVDYANQAQKVIDGIVDSITRISQLNEQISNAANLQSRSVGGITSNIDNAVRLSDETVEVSRQTSQASENLEKLAVHLKQHIELFKT